MRNAVDQRIGFRVGCTGRHASLRTKFFGAGPPCGGAGLRALGACSPYFSFAVSVVSSGVGGSGLGTRPRNDHCIGHRRDQVDV